MKESIRARQAWADYLAMGAGRSLERLAEDYRSRARSVPTRQLSRLKRWSADFGWQQRLKDIADQEARDVVAQQAEYRRAIMEEGLALDHERVSALKELAGVLLDELRQDDRRWVRDVKQIGKGETAEKVDVERFNAAEVEQLRGLLDDIAKEKGERKEGQASVLLQYLDLTKLTDEQLERLANGDDPLKILLKS